MSSEGSAHSPHPGLDPAWRRAGLLLGLAVLACFALYWEAARSIWAAWDAYKVYSHGYLIPPICAYVIWTRREALRALSPGRELLAAALILPFSVAWAGASFLDIALGEHLGFYAVLVLTVWALVGRRVLRVVAMPLLYLVLALPVWSHLLPILQQQTADTAALILRLGGVPVYHEGYYLVIPEGTFVVAEVCAGLRYLMATLAICGLYAMLNLRTAWAGVGFMAGSIALSIFFNWIRVISVIVAGHLTDMQSPIIHEEGHIPFGWAMFAVALVPIFFLGGWLQRVEDRRAEHGRAAPAGPRAVPEPGPGAGLGTLLLVVAAAAAGPLITATSAARDAARPVDVRPPVARAPWEHAGDPAPDWQPRYLGAQGEALSTYEGPAGERVSVYLAVYPIQGEGAELVSSVNALYRDERWGPGKPGVVDLARPVLGLTRLREIDLTGAAGARLIWYWYDVDGARTASDIRAKLLPLPALLVGRRAPSAVVAISTGYQDATQGRGQARARLEAFLADMHPALEQTLEAAFAPPR